ncbi:MAG: hypothetical protein DRP58_06455 [Spirochaetes bacterium]|nr:MAG: hypothetical protein DRP58_06455 [Spirochaetota bacterium]
MSRKSYWTTNDRENKLIKMIEAGYSRQAIYKKIVGSNGKPTTDGIRRQALKSGFGVKNENFTIKPLHYAKNSNDGIPIQIMVAFDDVKRVIPKFTDVPDKIEPIDALSSSEVTIEATEAVIPNKVVEPTTIEAPTQDMTTIELLVKKGAISIPAIYKELKGKSEVHMVGNERKLISVELKVTGIQRKEFTMSFDGIATGKFIQTTDLSTGDSTMSYRKIRKKYHKDFDVTNIYALPVKVGVPFETVIEYIDNGSTLVSIASETFRIRTPKAFKKAALSTGVSVVAVVELYGSDRTNHRLNIYKV